MRERKLLDPNLYYAAPDPYDRETLLANGITFVPTAAGKIRNVFSQPLSRLLAEFTCSAISAGAMTISLTATQTAALLRPINARFDEYRVLFGYYDVELTSGLTVVRAYHGPVYLDARQSR